MRHIQFNQHAGHSHFNGHGHYNCYANMWTAESCSLTTEIGHKSDHELFFNCFARIRYRRFQQRVFSPYSADIVEIHVELLHYNIPCDAHWKSQISSALQIWCAFDLKLTSDYICYFVQILFKLSLTLIFSMSLIYFLILIKGESAVWFLPTLLARAIYLNSVHGELKVIVGKKLAILL